MGVQGLWQLIEPTGRPVSLESLAGKVLAVDVSLWLHQAVKGMRDKKGNPIPHAHLLVIFNRLCKLLFYGVKPVLVFDGGVPTLKQRTMAVRRQQTNKSAGEARSAQDKLLFSYLQSKALETVTGVPASIPSATQATASSDMFDLPPLPNDALKPDEEDELETQIPAYDLERVGKSGFLLDGRVVDVESDDFKALPVEMQHDLLVEMKQSFKENSWTEMSALPKEADNFSQFQLEGLLRRSQLSNRLKKVRSELNRQAAGVIAGEMPSVLKGEADSNVVVHAGRLASDENTHIILIKRKLGLDKDGGLFSGLSNDEVTESQSQTGAHSDSQAGGFLPSSDNIAEDEHSSRSDCGQEDVDGLLEVDLPATNRGVTMASDNIVMSEVNLTATSHSVSTASHDIVMIDHDGNAFGQDIVAAAPDVTAIDQEVLPGDARCHDSLTVRRKDATSDIEKDSISDTNIASPLPVDVIDVDQIVDFPSPCSPCYDSDIELLTTQKTRPDTASSIGGVEIVLPVVENRTPFDDGTSLFSASDFIPAGDPSLLLSAEYHTSKTAVKTQPQLQLVKGSAKEKSEDQDSVSQPKDEAATLSVQKTSDVQQSAEVSQQSLTWSSAQLQATAPDLQEQLSREQQLLKSAQQSAARHMSGLTSQMMSETQELLRLFGVPYVVAPMEAEAQCAWLDSHGLVEGTVSDDSDIWLFGASTVYKNFFNQNRDAEMYQSNVLQNRMGLSREHLIRLAMLCGSDYTLGIKGIGAVLAMEVMNMFRGEDYTGLEKLREWWVEANKREPINESSLHSRLRKLVLPSTFPDRRVYQAYIRPLVDESMESFEWSSPDLQALRMFAVETFGWNVRRVDETLLPVMKRIHQKERQPVISEFLVPTSSNRSTIKSKRVRRVVLRMLDREQSDTSSQGGRPCLSSSGSDTDSDDNNSESRSAKRLDANADKQLTESNTARNSTHPRKRTTKGRGRRRR